jgi:hypothetical protein
MTRISVSRCGPGRPRTRPEQVVADRGYSSTKIRAYLRRRGIKAAIPESSAPVCTVLRADDEEALDRPLCGFLTDTWSETVPFDGKSADLIGDLADTAHRPYEVTGVALHFDRPDSRLPQALLLAVPPAPSRGWRSADLQAIVEDSLDLLRLRSLDLHDLPSLRQLLPLSLPDLPTPPP